MKLFITQRGNGQLMTLQKSQMMKSDLLEKNTVELTLFAEDSLVSRFQLLAKEEVLRTQEVLSFLKYADSLGYLDPSIYCSKTSKTYSLTKKGGTFRVVLSALEDLGYDLEWQILNSKNFGVAQHRERVFIIGFLRGEPRSKVFPFRRTSSQTTRKLIDGKQAYRVYDTFGLSVTLKSDGGGIGAKTGLYLINKDRGKIKYREDVNCIDANYHKGVDNHAQRTMILYKPVAFTEVRTDEAKELRRRSLREGKDWSPRRGKKLAPRKDELMNCLVSKQRDAHIVFDGYAIRRLTPRECWRLQGFPDWAFDKARRVGISDTQLYRQAGNAVTVNVSYKIGEKLAI